MGVAHEGEVEDVVVPQTAEGVVEQRLACGGVEGEAGGGEVVGVVDFGPPGAVDDLGADGVALHVDEHAEDELVEGVAVDEVRVGRKQRPEDVAAEVAVEAVDVEGLVLVGEVEGLALQVRGPDVGDDAVVHGDDGAVHAGTPAVDEGDVAGASVEERVEHGGVEEEVALDENDVGVEGDGVQGEGERDDVVRHEEAVVVDELDRDAAGGDERTDVGGAVAGDDGDVANAAGGKGVEGASEDGGAGNCDEGLVQVVGDRPHPPAEAGGEDDGLHEAILSRGNETARLVQAGRSDVTCRLGYAGRTL